MRSAQRSRRALWWERLPRESLLDVRLRDLDLRIEDSPLGARVAHLHRDLERARLRFRPHVWLSTDWFSPEGVPGFAIPFYLAHRRLAALERSEMLQAEGGDARWCMQLLRHETGHAIDSAYRLHYRKSWRRVFGKASRAYRVTYVPNPESRRFVHHLPDFYAQSHPLEDFAETFAIWLQPGSHWRAHYRGSPALRKLEFTDALMREIADEPPRLRSRERTDSLPKLRMTLREYYERKKFHYGREDFSIYDRDLLRLFSQDPEHRRRKPAARFLRERRGELGQIVCRWTGQHRFVADDVLRGMTLRCRELGLHLSRPEPRTAQGAAVVVTLHTARIQRMRHREYFR